MTGDEITTKGRVLFSYNRQKLLFPEHGSGKKKICQGESKGSVFETLLIDQIIKTWPVFTGLLLDMDELEAPVCSLLTNNREFFMNCTLFTTWHQLQLLRIPEQMGGL